jgi:hypothetical protein
MIHQVEGFHMEFERQTLAEMKHLKKVEVELIEITGIKEISHRSSIGVFRGILKCGSCSWAEALAL